jgi:hypothetical protein
MSNEAAFTETELAQRWAINIKTLQRWRSGGRGPRYYKLSKAVRYSLADVVAHEEAQRQGLPIADELPPIPCAASATTAPAEPAPAAPEPKRYTLREASELVAQYGSLQAAEAAIAEANGALR